MVSIHRAVSLAPGHHSINFIERKGNVATRCRSGYTESRMRTVLPQELLFEQNDVRITPHVASFGSTSYQISSIGSVHVGQRKKRHPMVVVVFLLGLGTLATAIVASRATGLPDDYFPMAAIGVSVMVAAFLLQFVWPRHLYVLVLRTSSGDVDALTSHEKKLVSNARQALEQAFMIRAGQAASSAELGSEAAIRQALDVAARASHETMPRY
jgi:Family of unknown function (DUF6232)